MRVTPLSISLTGLLIGRPIPSVFLLHLLLQRKITSPTTHSEIMIAKVIAAPIMNLLDMVLFGERMSIKMIPPVTRK